MFFYNVPLCLQYVCVSDIIFMCLCVCVGCRNQCKIYLMVSQYIKSYCWSYSHYRASWRLLTDKKDVVLRVCILIVCVRVQPQLTVNQRLTPPPLSSSDRIPQVLGSVFQTAVRGEKKSKQVVTFPTCVCIFFSHFTVLEKTGSPLLFL